MLSKGFDNWQTKSLEGESIMGSMILSHHKYKNYPLMAFNKKEERWYRAEKIDVFLTASSIGRIYLGSFFNELNKKVTLEKVTSYFKIAKNTPFNSILENQIKISKVP